VKYLLKTPKGVFLVDAPNYEKACEYGRLSGIAKQDEGIQMIGGFAPPVRYAEQLMNNPLIVGDPAALKKAIEEYADMKVRESWQGGGDPESIPLIGQELAESIQVLKDLTGLEFV
jgi:alkanesulfonate monooxygenase SsuD/methylene tetrahydromethanopterin reductase-like flavin-dependent oxidoreductase (luciferase family)